MRFGRVRDLSLGFDRRYIFSHNCFALDKTFCPFIPANAAEINDRLRQYQPSFVFQTAFDHSVGSILPCYSGPLRGATTLDCHV